MNKLKSIFNSPYGLFETQRRKGRPFFWLHLIYLGISHFPTGGFPQGDRSHWAKALQKNLEARPLSFAQWVLSPLWEKSAF